MDELAVRLGFDELAVHLGFDASLVDIWFLTFRDIVIFWGGVLAVEGEASTPSRNVGNQIPSDAASYPEERIPLNCKVPTLYLL